MPKQSYWHLLEYAKKCLREKDRAGAKKTALRLVREYPEGVEGWLLLAGLSNPDEAHRYIAKAKNLAPDDPHVISADNWANQAASKHDLAIAVNRQEIEKPLAQPGMKNWLQRIRQHGLTRALAYLGKKAILIGLTIFLGVFITIVIMNRSMVLGFVTAEPQLDSTIESSIQRTIQQYIRNNPSLQEKSPQERNEILADVEAELRDESGIDLPYFQRHLRWTINAMRFEWGRLRVGDRDPFIGLFRASSGFDLNDIILTHLPNTLLIVGTAYFLIFLLGLPLALMFARNYGRWYDRLFSILAPLSSVPSWVIGIVLITIFAFELRWLPAGRMVGSMPPDTQWGYILVVLRHMILPVSAIFLSLFFHLVYSWRTYFVTFSSEDYVDLGKAVGLPDKKLQKDYILKPSLSYVITSFSLMFVSFWQMTMALEVVFNWPGIGWLYIIRALPNLWGESVYPGDMVVAISLVVMFAYMMGVVVLLLDLVYVLVDPRIRLGQKSQSLRLKQKKRSLKKSVQGLLGTKRHQEFLKVDWGGNGDDYLERTQPVRVGREKKNPFFYWVKRAAGEIVQYPSAVIGFIIIMILIIGSVYAVVFLPYETIGEEWRRSSLSEFQRRPQLARPSWINLFRSEKYLSSHILNSQAGEAEREVIPISDEMDNILLTFNFDYDYVDFPSEMHLRLNGQFTDKRAFASITWHTPDGRELDLRDTAVGNNELYSFGEGIPYRRWVSENPNYQAWFNLSDLSATPAHYLLFADPESTVPSMLHGDYQLVVDGLTFEPDGDIDVELVMLGQVFGLAGTDFYRRDLLVPLLWGMPFALLIGLGGALTTTLVSMVFAATGVWFGGWMDNLVQRLIDMNLVLPILAISVMAYAFLGISLWTILIVYVFLNAFGTPTKNFRAAFLQIKDAPYIEAAKAYGTKNSRIILKYMVPRLIPVLIPQLVILIPAFVFLEATLGFFNVRMLYPTWGTVIYQATMRGGLFFSRFWMLQPIALLLLTGVGFSLFGFALERILNPKLMEE